MAKKTFSLDGMMDEFESNVQETNKQKKKEQGRVEKSADGIDKSKGSAWRQEARPFRKTIHCDENVHTLVNLVANIYNKKVDDVLFECIQDGLYRNYGKSIEEVIANKK